MRKLFAILITVTLCLSSIAWVSAAEVESPAEEYQRPMVLLFDVSVGDGADKTLAAAATKALRMYMHETNRVDAMIFERESPTVLRAIMDKRLTADSVASYSSRTQRLEVAKTLAFQYAAGAEISIKNQSVEIALWVAKVDGGKRAEWESTGSAAVGGTGDINADNAMQCAASAVVIDMVEKAFADIEPVDRPVAASGDQTIALPANQIQALPNAVEYKSAADFSLDAGNLALAIQQYTQAVNADPMNGELRIKLAEAYARKGLYNDANNELNQALFVGADKALVDASRDRIDAMRNGETTSGQNANAEQNPASQPSAKSDGEVIDVVVSKSNTSASVQKIIEGDNLWNAGKLKEASDAYKAAMKLNSGDWRIYERLAILNASMGLFSESRQVLALLAVVQPNPAPEMVRTRYDLLTKAFDSHFNGLIKQYDNDSSNYLSHKITRESYYNCVKGYVTRLESMALFVDQITVPLEKQSANLHRSLASGLMSQAASSMLDYLETNNENSKTNAEVIEAKARKEIEAAAK